MDLLAQNVEDSQIICLLSVTNVDKLFSHSSCKKYYRFYRKCWFLW